MWQQGPVGSPGGRRAHACRALARPALVATALGILELHPVQAVEQGPGILLIAGLARIVGAQGQAAYTGELLGRDLGILLAVELLPEILIEPAAVHLGLSHNGGGHWARKRRKRNGSDGKALH